MELYHKSPDKWLLFVYGTLKKEGGNHAHEHFMSEAKFVGGCSIPGVMLHLGGYPGLVANDLCRVTGEVYEVTDQALQRMDGYEGVPYNYSRRLVMTPFGNSWCYYKNHVPQLSDSIVVVNRGVWTGESTMDKISYGKLKYFFNNRQWNEPEFRDMKPPMLVDQIPESSPASRPTPKETELALPPPPPKFEVGPGVEMM